MKTFKAVLALVVILYVVIALFKLGPVYFHYMGFKDAIEQEARNAAYSQRDERAIRADLDKAIIEYQIPLKAEDMDVHKAGAAVSIKGDYTEHVDLPLHPIDLTFHVGADNNGSLIR